MVRGFRRVDDAVELPADATVVVVDVLRATTTIAYALAAGAERIVPVNGVDDAVPERDRWVGRGANCLLAGERGGLPPAGFDLGNSPRSMTNEVVGRRTLVMTTSNGTRAILAAAHCRRVVTGAIVSASAAADALRNDPGPIVMLCAGADGSPGIEDNLGAGAIIEAMARHRAIECDAVSDSFRQLWTQIGRSGIAEALRDAPAGQALARVGLVDDIGDCARVDTCPVVGHWHPEKGITKV